MKRRFGMQATAAAIALAAMAHSAAAAEAATSGRSADGSMRWTTSATAPGAVTGAYSMVQTATRSASGTQVLQDTAGDKITAYGASYGGFLTAGDSGNGGINNPSGGASLKLPVYFANTTSKTDESYLDVTFAAPVKYFTGLITGNNGTGTLTFYNGATTVMTLALKDVAYLNTTNGYYSAYLSALTDDGSTFSRVRFDEGFAAAGATYGDGGIGSAYASLQSPYVALADSVPEPADMATTMLIGLGLFAAGTTLRRR